MAKCKECGGPGRGRNAHTDACSIGKANRAKREKRAGKGRKARAVAEPMQKDIVDSINGRTKTVTLLRLQNKVAELLKGRDDAEKIKKALTTVDELQKKLDEAKALIS